MFSRCIDCFNHCSTTHNMLVVIIDILSMIMTCAFFKRSMTTLVSRRIDKYPRVGIWNIVCTVVVVEFKWNVIVHIVANNSTFLSSNYNYFVMYFIKKIATIRCACDKCKPWGFLVMECNFIFCSSFNYMMEMCVKYVLQRFGNKLHFIWFICMYFIRYVCKFSNDGRNWRM